MRLIDADALINYCNNLKDKTIDANDIVRFPTVGSWIIMKEQEPVIWSYDGYNCFVCSNCGLRINDEVYYLMDKPISFCPACGRKVKWDD